MLNLKVIILIIMILLSISPNTFRTMGSWNIQMKKTKKLPNGKQQMMAFNIKSKILGQQYRRITPL